MAMQEAKWEGTSNEFLTWWINNEAKEIKKKEKINKCIELLNKDKNVPVL